MSYQITENNISVVCQKLIDISMVLEMNWDCNIL